NFLMKLQLIIRVFFYLCFIITIFTKSVIGYAIDPSCKIVCNSTIQYIGLGCTCEPCSTIESRCSDPIKPVDYSKCKKINDSMRCTEFFRRSPLVQMQSQSVSTPQPTVTSQTTVASQTTVTSTLNNSSLSWQIPVICGIVIVIVVIIVCPLCKRFKSKKKRRTSDNEAGIPLNPFTDTKFNEEEKSQAENDQTTVLNVPTNNDLELVRNSDSESMNDEASVVEPFVSVPTSVSGHQTLSINADVHQEPTPPLERASSIRESPEDSGEVHGSSSHSSVVEAAVATPVRSNSSSPNGASAAVSNVSVHCSEAFSNNLANGSSGNSSFDCGSLHEDLGSRSDGEAGARSSIRAPSGRVFRNPSSDQVHRRTMDTMDSSTQRQPVRDNLRPVLAEQTTLPVVITDNPSPPEMPHF
ncbi:hypothetical protein BOX15_Mlig020192g1, partial [Macrostomum lignano]